MSVCEGISWNGNPSSKKGVLSRFRAVCGRQYKMEWAQQNHDNNYHNAEGEQ